jgi:hypothetical protein
MRLLSKSMDTLRRQAAAGTLDPVALDVLDRVDPDWRLGAYERAWRAGLADCIAWTAAHHAFPRVLRIGYGTAEERRAGNWLARQRHGKRLDDAGRRMLDEQLPGWEVSSATDAYWRARLAAVAEWTAGSGALPRVKGTDDVERTHGKWLQAQRNGRNLTGAREAALDRDLPGWRDTRRTGAAWTRALDAAVAAHETHGRLPSRKLGDQAEQRAANWLSRQRIAALTPDQQQAMDARIPGWRGRG